MAQHDGIGVVQCVRVDVQNAGSGVLPDGLLKGDLCAVDPYQDRYGRLHVLQQMRSEYRHYIKRPFEWEQQFLEGLQYQIQQILVAAHHEHMSVEHQTLPQFQDVNDVD